LKRLFYNYFLLNFSVASVNLVVGTILLVFGGVFGGYKWYAGVRMDIIASPGTVMLAALPVILGAQLLLSFLNLDVANVPSTPIQRKLTLTG
jgi:hypothetical protein